MKKGLFLAMALSFVFIVSCGGGESSTAANKEEAYVVGTQFVGAALGSLPAASSLDADSYQTEVAYNWGPYDCTTSGTHEYRGTNYNNDTEAMGSWKYSYRVILNSCAGPDLLCGTDAQFTLNGEPTVAYEYRVDTHKYIITFGGSYSYEGPLSGTCAMDFSLTFDESPQTGAVNYSSSSGTMCGYSMADIEAMEDSGEDYCKILEDAIAAQ